jgi:sortase B
MKKIKYKLKKKYVIILIGLLGLIIISFVFIKVYKHYKIEKNVDDVLIKTETNIDKDNDEIFKETKSLKNLNSDFVGILTIPDTIINYPVMYTKGQDYYLRRSFDKKYSIAGSLYIDKYNTISPKDDNLIIYGHNMKNGTMFHELLNYKEEDFYNNHKYFYFTTDEVREKYEIVSMFVSKVFYKTDKVFKYYKFYNASSEEEFNYYKENILKLSLFDTGVELNYKDKFITLSTCDYSLENGRFVVIGKLIS